MNRWQGWAGGAPVPVFAAAGEGAVVDVEELRLREEIALVATPRHATVLLVAGAIPADCSEALARVHDQMPKPCATVWWGAHDDARASQVVARDVDPVPAIVEVHRSAFGATESHWLPDEPPVEWRGRGDHGQGGEGMTGGTPYGRPMAMTDDDLRDGLALDALSFRVGPFFPPLPPGLVLDVTLQGDVCHDVAVVRGPWREVDAPDPAAEGSPGDATRRRAARALRRLARALAWIGPPAATAACLRAARAARSGDAPELGPVRRAVRLAARAIPPRLGVAPDGSDVRARLQRWLADATQASRGSRAAAAGTAAARDDEHAVAERPVLSAAQMRELLVGMEWSEAMLTLVSLPLPDQTNAVAAEGSR